MELAVRHPSRDLRRVSRADEPVDVLRTHRRRRPVAPGTIRKVDHLTSRGAEDPLVFERQEGVPEPLLVPPRHRRSFEAKIAQRLVVRAKPSDQTVRAFDPHARQRGEVIAPAHHAHLQELIGGEPHEGEFAVDDDVGVSNLLSDAVVVHLEKNGFALVRHHVRVLGDDPVHETVAHEVGHLRVCFVRRHHALVSLRFESFDDRLGHLGGYVDRALVRLGGGGGVTRAAMGARALASLLARALTIRLLGRLTGHPTAVEDVHGFDAASLQERGALHEGDDELVRGHALDELDAARVRAAMEPAVRVHRHALAGVGVADVEGADDGLERREQGVDSHDAGAELARGDAARPAGCCHAAPSTADARATRGRPARVSPARARVEGRRRVTRRRGYALPASPSTSGAAPTAATSAAFPSGVQNRHAQQRRGCCERERTH